MSKLTKPSENKFSFLNCWGRITRRGSKSGKTVVPLLIQKVGDYSWPLQVEVEEIRVEQRMVKSKADDLCSEPLFFRQRQNLSCLVESSYPRFSYINIKYRVFFWENSPHFPLKPLLQTTKAASRAEKSAPQEKPCEKMFPNGCFPYPCFPSDSVSVLENWFSFIGKKMVRKEKLCSSYASDKNVYSRSENLV